MESPSPSAISDPPDELPSPPSEPRRRSEPPPLFSRTPPDPATPNLTPPPDGPEGSEASSPRDEKGRDRAQRSDIRSTTKQRASTKRRLKRSVAAAFGGATLRVNRMLARDAVELEYGPWVAEDAEKHGIAEPVAGLLSRRMGEGATSPDVADLIDALIALAAYVSNSLARRFELRRMVAAGEIIPPPEPEPEPQDEPADAVPVV